MTNAEKLRDAVALHLHMTAVVRDIKRGPSERKAGAS